MNSKKIINKMCYAFVISMFIIFFVGVLAQIYNFYIINNSGNISDIDATDAGVLIYSDPELSISLTQIDWGTISVNRYIDEYSTAQYIFYILNNGNATGFYTINTYNWDSIDTETNMILTWDYDGTSLNPNESIQVILTLSISPQIPITVTSFSFDITIGAEKV